MNRFWPILISTGIAPVGTTGPEADDTMPADVGVGFTDVGTGHPGTDRHVSAERVVCWQPCITERLRCGSHSACSQKCSTVLSAYAALHVCRCLPPAQSFPRKTFKHGGKASTSVYRPTWPACAAASVSCTAFMSVHKGEASTHLSLHRQAFLSLNYVCATVCVTHGLSAAFLVST